MTFDQFRAQTLGKQIDLDNYPKAQPYQCVDEASDYAVLVCGASRFTGNAKDIFGQQPGKFTWVRNTPNGVPPRGAVMVFGSAMGGGFGHVGIVESGNPSTFNLLEQNWGAPRVTEGTHNYNGVIGWGIPKVNVNPAPAPASGGGVWKAVRVAYARIAPHVNSPLGGTQVLHVGETFNASGSVIGDSVGGNNVWVRSERGNYVWSGNLTKIG